MTAMIAASRSAPWPRPPKALQAARLGEPPAGARVTVAGLVLVRQRPGTAKGVIFVTLDPARDTPQVLREYVTAFHPSFVGLRGDEATTAAVARDFKVFYARQAGSTAGTYSLDHSTGSYAYDPEGRLRLLIRHGETPDNVASDLRQLLAGK